jgi:hypothetical protein
VCDVAVTMSSPACPKCGRQMDLALPSDGTKGKRFYQCFNCDRPDPLKSENDHARPF